MLTARIPILPPKALVILDRDDDLTLAKMPNVLIAHWRGPSDARNSERLAKALRALAQESAIGFVSVIEPSSAPPSKEQRRYLTRLVCELDVRAITAVVRGSALRRSFATVVLTGMTMLVSPELSERTSICSSERDAAAWIVKHVPSPPPEGELARALEYLQA